MNATNPRPRRSLLRSDLARALTGALCGGLAAAAVGSTVVPPAEDPQSPGAVVGPGMQPLDLGPAPATNPAASPDPSRAPVVEDLELTLRVQAKLSTDRQLKALPLRAEAARGVVLLTGVAPGPTEVAVAQRLTETVPGVTQVVNRIVVYG